MNEEYESVIRSASTALEPIATGAEPCLVGLPDIRAVLFDIYGTLMISASGDIGAADPAVRGEAFAAALQAVGWEFPGDPTAGAAKLCETIQSHHARSHQQGNEYPEIDIVEVWREVCQSIAKQGGAVRAEADYARLAIEYEVRVNPVWTMPGMVPCLEELRRLGMVMGIISNAQFFTPLVFPAIAGKSLDELGFDPELRYYSYEHGCAKPGRALYEMAVRQLAAMNLEPRQALFVGNDMRNDIWPAAEVGFRTALFSGDKRSLRMRSSDANRDQYANPDAILTDLHQIPPLIASGFDNR